MQLLHPITWLLSLGLHAGLLLAIVGVTTSGTAYDAGSGTDAFVVEQGIAVEGMAKLGEAEEMIETVDIPPVQEAVEPKPVEEIEPEVTDVVTSTLGEHEEQVVTEEPKPVEEEKPVATPVEEQAPQVAALVEKSSGAAEQGGKAAICAEYLSRVRKAFEGNIVSPRTSETGTTVVKFTVDNAGNVVGRDVLSSSGSNALDRAALASLERVGRFPSKPKELTDAPVELTIPFRYTTKSKKGTSQDQVTQPTCNSF